MPEIVKIVVTVPTSHADELRKVIGELGAGQVGNYSYCSYSVTGIGRFLPNDGASPAIGQVGKLETVEEERIEINCAREHLNTVVSAIKAAHPYEEPAIDAYLLLPVG